jgi:L-fuconolactonase
VPDEASRGTVEQLIYEMDAHRVSQAIVVCAAIENNPDNLDYVAFARGRHPDRILLMADLDCPWSRTYHEPGSAERLRVLCDRYDPVGFAHYLESDNDGWLASEEADAVFALAADRGLIVSVGATPTWQRDLRVLARRHPSVPILCQSLGGIQAAEGLESPGLAEVIASADVPNVYIKVAGMHYATPRGWNHPWPDVHDALERIYNAYGPGRLCWGSDFPASTRFTTYRQTLEVVCTHCPFFSEEDLSLVLGGTLRALLASA